MTTLRLAALAPVLVALLLLGSGCGNGDASDLRLIVGCLAVDGGVPPGLKAVHVDETGAPQGAYDLVAVEGGAPGEHRVVGGPEGSYRVEGPEGWWMLQMRTHFPELRRDQPPREVRVGRARAVYIAAATPDLRPGRIWGAERVLADGTREPVPVETAIGERGFVAVVRIAKEHWRGEIELYGHLEIGPPGASAPDAPPGPVTEPIRFEAQANGRPVVRSVRQAPLSPLEVVLVAASPQVPVEGRTVEVEIEDLPLRVVYRATCRDGVARFRAVSTVTRDLTIRLPHAKQSFRYSREAWKRNANLRLLVTGDLMTLQVSVAANARPDLVLVRPQGAVAFARVPFTLRELPRARVPLHAVFEAPSGRFSVLIRSGTAWTGAYDLEHDELDLLLPFAAPAVKEGITVRGPVKGAAPGTVVRFFLQRGKEAVLGDGFSVKVSPTGTYEAFLPAGTWHVEVAGPRGVRRLEQPLVAEDPGAGVHLPLDAP